jgi:hypothetical protein
LFFRPAALTTAATTSLVNRVQRVNDNSTVWRGSVGSLNPTLVDNFSANIADRFPPTADKFKMKPLGGEDAEKPEPLPLINGLTLQTEEKPSEPERPAWSYFPDSSSATPATSSVGSPVASRAPATLPSPKWPELGQPAPVIAPPPPQRKIVGHPVSRVEEVLPGQPKENKSAAPTESGDAPRLERPREPRPIFPAARPSEGRQAIIEEQKPAVSESVSRSPVSPSSVEPPIVSKTSNVAREELPSHKPELVEARGEASAPAGEAQPAAPRWPELGQPAPEMPLTQQRVTDIVGRTPTERPEAAPPSAQTFEAPVTPASIQRQVQEPRTPPPPSAVETPRPAAPPSVSSQRTQPLAPVTSRTPSPKPGAPPRPQIGEQPAPEKNILVRALANLSMPLTKVWPRSVRRMIQRLFVPDETAPEPPGEAAPEQPARTLPRSARTSVVHTPALVNRPIGEMAVNVNRLTPSIAQRAVRVSLMASGWRFKTAPSEASADLGLLHRAASGLGSGAGRPLQRETREKMETTLGRDFSNVRVHTAQLSPLHVQAAAKGDDIYFNEGQDNFDTPQGLAVLGHELTHVAQSGAAPSKPVARMSPPQTHTLARVASDEAQADQVERTILSGAQTPLPLSGPVAVPRVAAAPAIARMAEAPIQRAQETGTPEQEDTPGQNFFRNLKEKLSSGMALPPSSDSPGDTMETLTQSVTKTTEAVVDAKEQAPQKTAVDLDDMARQIYPLIKRLLAVERERNITR